VVIIAEYKKDEAEPSFRRKEMAAESSINNPSAISTRLNTLAIILKLII
jgi:hypothetical protein